MNRSKAEGRLGMNFVERVALAAGWKPIAVPEEFDTGIDALLEFDENGATHLIAIQVKRGSSYFDRRGAKYQADAAHLRYWRSYALPVVLIIVKADESSAFWMDVREHLRNNPSVVGQASCALRPTQSFDGNALRGPLRALTPVTGLGEAVAALTDPILETRLSALPLFYRFRLERSAPFCLAGAMRVERDIRALGHFCDFYSRYLWHPEAGFGASGELSAYARAIEALSPRPAAPSN